MKIGLVTDTHWGARNDNVAFLDYFHKFYDNAFFPYLDKHNIKTVIHLGDVVDRRKFINFATLRRLKEDFIQKLYDRNTDFHVIIGNHDVPYRNTNDVNAMNELFGGYKDDFVSFYDSVSEVKFDDCNLLLVPWINEENYEESILKIKTTKSEILFGHLEISGFEMHAGIYSDSGLQPSLFKDFDVVLSGHFHHRNTRDNITYLGCPYEITWADYDNPKGFHIFDTDTRELTFIPNPYKMFHKVWYDDEDADYDSLVDQDFSVYTDAHIKIIVQSKTNPYWFDMFLDKIYKANPGQVSIVDDHKNLDKESEEDIVDEAEDTLTVLNKYINNMTVDVDKGKLHTLVRELYTEALQMDV